MPENQYSNIITYDKYIRPYKEAESKERKEEIISEVMQEIRKINTFPEDVYTAQSRISSMRTLANTDLSRVYNSDKNEIGFGSAGLDVLYQFYPNIWKVQKKDSKYTVMDAFFIDKKLRRALHKTFTYSDDIVDLRRWMRMTGQGYVVNFRPVAAKCIYELNAQPADGRKGVRVFDYASGYGGRLLGAWSAENVSEYVAVDVNTETVENAHKLIKFLNKYLPKLKKTEVHLCGSEDFIANKHHEYKGYFDIAFSSPQYFDTEIYSKEDTQSCHKFPKYESWVRGFYRPTIHNAIDSLREGGVFAINIFEKLNNLKEITKLLASEKGFYLYKIDKMLLRSMPGHVKDSETGEFVNRDLTTGNNSEPVWYFKHYETLYKDGTIGIEKYKELKKKHEIH